MSVKYPKNGRKSIQQPMHLPWWASNWEASPLAYFGVWHNNYDYGKNIFDIIFLETFLMETI